MGRAGLDAVEAFRQINSHSQDTNRKVVVASQEIIDQALKLAQDGGNPTRRTALTELLNARS